MLLSQNDRLAGASTFLQAPQKSAPGRRRMRPGYHAGGFVCRLSVLETTTADVLSVNCSLRLYLADGPRFVMVADLVVVPGPVAVIHDAEPRGHWYCHWWA
jgi:hypothetical protein